MRALRRILPSINVEEDELPPEVLNNLIVLNDDFKDALRELEPSALREVIIESPNVRWTEIGGLEAAKQELRETIEWPLKYPKLFEHMKGQTPKGILLYGPPGTGKTLLAKAVATETEANFISVKGPEFLSKWVGESEKAVRETFRKAKQAAPCIVFFDEIDAIVPTRGSGFGDAKVTERVISQILTELDGLESLHDIVVIGATNRADMIDQAILRPGRFDRMIYIPDPDFDARKEIFKIHTREKPISSNVKLDKLAKATEGFSGADIAAVCNEAVMLSIREYVSSGGTDNAEKIKKNKLTMKHFQKAIQKVKPRKTGEPLGKAGHPIPGARGAKYGKYGGKPKPSPEDEEMYV
jgi:transitional endoplasmic reticulum ATPase